MIGRKIAFRADIFVKPGVGTNTQRQDVIQQLMDKKNKTPSMEFSNPGCFRIENPCAHITWLFDEINVILTEAVRFYKQEDSVFAKFALTADPKIVWWANINSPGSRNTFHTHREDEFSCVYYLQGSGTGDLRFPNPANLLGDCSKTSPFTRDFLFAPNDGDLILFPSWMPHEVEPNLSNRDRINIAFNFKVTQ